MDRQNIGIEYSELFRLATKQERFDTKYLVDHFLCVIRPTYRIGSYCNNGFCPFHKKRPFDHTAAPQGNTFL